MKIELNRVRAPFDFEAVNEDGAMLPITGAGHIGGSEGMFRPMQAVVAALGGCSSIDILLILQKQKQEVTSYRVELDAVRREGEVPSIFKSIHVKYYFEGTDLNPAKVERAIKLSMEKYCSVTKILQPTCEITHSFEIEG